MKDRQLETKVFKAEEDIRTTVQGKRKNAVSSGSANAAIAAVNGEGDGSNISTTIIQVRCSLPSPSQPLTLPMLGTMSWRYWLRAT